MSGIEWARVEIFQLDKYIGLSQALSNVSTPNPAMSEARGELQRFQIQAFHRLTPEERLNLLSDVAAQ